MVSILKKTVVVAMACTLLVSCEKRREVLDLQHQTEEIHDVAMKEMAAMNRLTRQLKKDETGSPEHRDSLATAVHTMEKAEEEMMNWMRNYHAPKSLPTDQAMAYLNEQKKAIELNLQNIRTATEAGKIFAKQ